LSVNDLSFAYTHPAHRRGRSSDCLSAAAWVCESWINSCLGQKYEFIWHKRIKKASKTDVYDAFPTQKLN